MNAITIRSKVGPDGALHLDLPPGFAEANQDVEVTVVRTTRKAMTQEEYRDWVYAMAGSITDPEFKRHDQGVLEERDPL